jgi:L-ribulose-5-phosphate 3-epimerase
MEVTRRDFVKQAAIATVTAPVVARAQTPPSSPLPLRIGMTDWNLGKRGDITKIALAREIGLDGIQVSLTFPTDGSPHLREPKTQAAFKQAALENGIQICSLAIGSPGKSRLPLHTNPAAAILLVEAIEVARNLGTTNILLPILGDSHIHMENQQEVDTFVAMMKEVARYAEQAGLSSRWKTGFRRRTTSGCSTRLPRTTSACITTRGTSRCACTIRTVSRRASESGSIRSTSRTARS